MRNICWCPCLNTRLNLNISINYAERAVVNTYNSVLTVQVVSAGVVISACLKVGELRILGTGEGVHLDSGPGVPPPSHHDPVLKFNGTGMPVNENVININIYSYTIITWIESCLHLW